MKMPFPTALAGMWLTLLAIFAACSTAPLDTTPPQVLSTSPADGSHGVLKGVQLLVRFSEPMGHACTEAAYNSGDEGLKPNQVAFNWDDDQTLRITPNDYLAYSGDENDKVYTFAIRETACDLAGNTMSSPSVTRFYVLRRLLGVLQSEADLDGYVFDFGRVDTDGRDLGAGDGPNGETARAFFSFDLSELNPDPVEVVSARLLFKVRRITGNPANNLGPLLVEHVHYGSHLDENAFDLDVLSPRQPCSLSNLTGPWLGCWKGVEVQDDVAKWLERGGRSQFRLRFTRDTDGNGAEDSAMFYSGNATGSEQPLLEVVYYAP